MGLGNLTTCGLIVGSIMFDEWLNFRGELAALLSACIWAIAAVVYVGIGRKISPLMINLVKGVISIGLLLLTLLLQGEFLPHATPIAVGLLMLSGAIGIGMGDTAYFEALYCLGARRALLLEALAPPLTAVLALVFLQEALNWQAWVGIGLTIAGVTWVVIERTPASHQENLRPWRGIGCGILAAIGQAGGAVLSRAAFAQTNISPLWSTLIRLTAGMLVLVIWLLAQRQTAKVLEPLRSGRLLRLVAITAFFSTYLGIWLQQIALKFTAAGIAQSLNATSPLFVLPVALATGERISLRALLGAIVAIGGIWLLFST